MLIEHTDFQTRLAAVRAELERRCLAAVLLYGSAVHRSGEADPVEFISHFVLSGEHALAMVPLNGEPSMIITPTADYGRAKQESWIEAVTAVDDILGGGRRLRPRGKLGVCGLNRMPAGFHAGLQRFLAAEWEPCDDFMEIVANSLEQHPKR